MDSKLLTSEIQKLVLPNFLTPWSRVLYEKLIVPQLVNIRVKGNPVRGPG
jgi:hypothetical protein